MAEHMIQVVVFSLFIVFFNSDKNSTSISQKGDLWDVFDQRVIKCVKTNPYHFPPMLTKASFNEGQKYSKIKGYKSFHLFLSS